MLLNLKDNVIPSTVSLTVYRALIILTVLLQGGKTQKELIEILEKFDFNKDSNLKENLRVTLTTLRNFGCIISRPTEKNKFQYILEYCPFTVEISSKEANILNSLRKSVEDKNDYQTTIKINSLFEKILDRVDSEETKNLIKSKEPFSLINKNILKRLLSGEIIGKITEFNYISPKNGLETLHFIPERFTMKNSHLFLWGYSFKYSEYAFINAERIKDIVSVQENKQQITLPVFKSRFTIVGESKQKYQKEENEEIISSENGKTVVEALVNNQFMFFQRLLSFGSDLKTLEPEFVREQFLTKLYSIKERYQDENIQ